MKITESESKKTILACCLLLFISYFSMKIGVPLLPELHRHFGVSTQVFKFSMAAFLFFYACSQLVWGCYADHVGHRQAMTIGLLLA